MFIKIDVMPTSSQSISFAHSSHRMLSLEHICFSLNFPCGFFYCVINSINTMVVIFRYFVIIRRYFSFRGTVFVLVSFHSVSFASTFQFIVKKKLQPLFIRMKSRWKISNINDFDCIKATRNWDLSICIFMN